MTFAKNKDIAGTWDFPSMLIDLISRRPSVCAPALSAFPDLRSLAIRVVHDEFDVYAQKSSKDGGMEVGPSVVITLCHSPAAETKDKAVEVTLPLALLQSASVLLSIWKEEDDDAESTTMDNNNEAAQAVNDIVRMLMHPQEGEISDEPEKANCTDGLASARIAGSGKNAVPVESVSGASYGSPDTES
jgi:hypothetical protein